MLELYHEKRSEHGYNFVDIYLCIWPEGGLILKVYKYDFPNSLKACLKTVVLSEGALSCCG